MNPKLALGLVAAFAAIGIGIWQGGAQQPWRLLLGYWVPLVGYYIYLRVAPSKKTLARIALIIVIAYYAFIVVMRAIGTDRIFTLPGVLIFFGMIAAVWIPMYWMCKKAPVVKESPG